MPTNETFENTHTQMTNSAPGDRSHRVAGARLAALSGVDVPVAVLAPLALAPLDEVVALALAAPQVALQPLRTGGVASTR